MPLSDLHAAGAVVVRDKGREVLLVHRPKYDDWSFPKGKLDPGEHRATAAVREVLEESDVRVRLGRPLPGQRYGIGNGRMKVVHYWVGHLLPDSPDGTQRAADKEVDEVRWVDWDEAELLLSYRRDRDLLGAARQVARKTTAQIAAGSSGARARVAQVAEAYGVAVRSVVVDEDLGEDTVLVTHLRKGEVRATERLELTQAASEVGAHSAASR